MMQLTKSKSAYIGPYREEGGADGTVVGGSAKVDGANVSDTGLVELVFFF